MEKEVRKQQIASVLDSMRVLWPAIREELKVKKNDLIQNLIAADNEQTRGRIKELEDLINLPTTLYQELMAIESALAE